MLEAPATAPLARRRLLLFGALSVVCTGLAVAAILSAAGQDSAPERGSSGAGAVLPAAERARRPVLLYRSLAQASHGQPGIASLPAPGRETPKLAPLNCDRVAFAGGTGLCLARGRGFAQGYEAKIFGPDLKVRGHVGVEGIASRARVSRDGRWGSVTLFVAGHSYAVAGAFSTQTTIIDMRRAEKIADLEDFTTYRGDRVVTAVDRNYWGVTFAPDNDTFYATLATGGKTYLVQGTVSARTMRTLHGNVECPSLSPDATRIAYKKRVGDGERPWQLAVLDLTTMKETLLPGTAGLDDQAEWLDDTHVLYGVHRQIRVVDADGTARPRPFLDGADSPAVVRWDA